MPVNRDAIRLLGLGAISLGVAFLLLYATGSAHPVYRLVFGVGFVLLGLVNLDAVRRSRRR